MSILASFRQRLTTRISAPAILKVVEAVRTGQPLACSGKETRHDIFDRSTGT
jgi:hypothetical protein